MEIINNDEIKNNVSIEEAYCWVSDVITHKKEMILPAKISMKLNDMIFYNTMPCILPKYHIAGVKMVNRYPQNSPILKSDLLLYDLDTGNLKAIMDADYITSIRTGAVAAHSILLFAKKDYKTIALIGLGNVTKMTFRVFLNQYDGREMNIKLFKYGNDAENFIDEFKYNKNLNFEICDTYEKLMQDSDIIVSGIAYVDKDFCNPDIFKKGCLIVPIHTRGFQQCDLVFDKIFGDDTNHLCGFKYFEKFKSFNEVCEVINRNAVGRENDDERILVYNIGIALHDLYFANMVYEKLYHK